MPLMYETMSSILPHVKAGRLRGLGVTSAKRSAAVADLPSISETLPGFDVSAWGGIVVPAKVPKANIVKLNVEMNKVLSNPAFREKFNATGNEIVGGTSEQFVAHVRKETQKWADVIKRSGLKID